MKGEGKGKEGFRASRNDDNGGNERSPATKTAGKPADAKMISERHALAKILEGDLPYDRDVYIRETKRYLKRSIEDILMAGKLLLVLQEREGYGAFITIVEDEIGIPHTTAYRFMNAALNDEAHPRIDFSQLGKVSKVYTLLEAPEEELKKFEQLGLFAGKDMDELAKMSVKDLRDMVKDLRDKKEQYVARELRKVIDEKNALQRERDMLRRKHPNDLGTWVSGNRPHFSQLWENFLEQWRWFAMNENTLLNDEAQDFMVEFYDRIFADLDSIDETRYEKTGNRYGRRKK